MSEVDAEAVRGIGETAQKKKPMGPMIRYTTDFGSRVRRTMRSNRAMRPSFKSRSMPSC